MTGSRRIFERWAKPLLALAILGTLGSFSRLPEPTPEERARLAASFAFTRFELHGPPDLALSGTPIRPVHPSLRHIAAWISAVGAAVAVADVDGDGLPNDVCQVDTRADRVVVAPLAGARFAPFVLLPPEVDNGGAGVAPMGCLPGDFNEDGLTDLLAYFWGRNPVAFLRRSPAAGLAAAAFRAVEVGSPGERWYSNAATRADLDGDGHLDLVVGNYFQDGAFILAGGGGPQRMQASMSRAFNGGRNRLLLWQGATAGAEPTAAFSESVGALDEEVARGWTLAAGAADLDGDLLPEIYFANDFGPDRLLHNRSRPGELRFVPVVGRKTFFTPSSKVLGKDSFKGMGVDFADLNGDGLLDIYVSNIAQEFALEESHFLFLSTGEPEAMGRGTAPYVDASETLGLSRSGWAWESRLADFDNDGVPEAVQATGFLKGWANRWPELHETAMGNDLLLARPAVWHRFRLGDDLSGRLHNPFFVRAADGRYHDLAPELGLGDAQVSRGIATGDVDGDGDLDFAVANQWEPSYFYRNDAPRPGAALSLALLQPLAAGAERAVAVPEGARPRGWPAVGATAEVTLPDGRRLVAEVDGGNGHSGVRDPSLHFGLGEIAAGRRLPVRLRWRDPGGAVHRQTLELAPGRYTVLLGWPAAEEG